MLIAGCVCGGLGILFLILGICFISRGKKNFYYPSQVQGQIIDMCVNAYAYNHGPSEDGKVKIHIGGDPDNDMYCPVYTYWANGIQYRKAHMIAWDLGTIRRRMNQTVPVYYDPRDPAKSTLSKRSPLVVVGSVFTPVGAFLTILGGIFLFMVMG